MFARRVRRIGRGMAPVLWWLSATTAALALDLVSELPVPRVVKPGFEFSVVVSPVPAGQEIDPVTVLASGGGINVYAHSVSGSGTARALAFIVPPGSSFGEHLMTVSGNFLSGTQFVAGPVPLAIDDANSDLIYLIEAGPLTPGNAAPGSIFGISLSVPAGFTIASASVRLYPTSGGSSVAAAVTSISSLELGRQVLNVDSSGVPAGEYYIAKAFPFT